jgi:hypothetical protein
VTGKLLAYYVGDSIYAFFSKNSIEWVKSGDKKFNHPFQVGTWGDDEKSACSN